MAVIAAVRSQFQYVLLLDRDADTRIHQCDLMKSHQIKRALRSIRYNDCDSWTLLVASGLYDGREPNTTASWHEVEASIRINLLGVCEFVLGFAETVRATRKPARIVVVSSAAAIVGSYDIGYTVS